MKYEEMNLLFARILSMSFLLGSYVTSIKVDIKPPKDMTLDIAKNYFHIMDSVLVSHVNSSVAVDDYAQLLHNNSIFASLFEWETNVSFVEQFTNFIKVVSSGKHRRIVYFLDHASTEIFLRYAHMVRDNLPLVCFYKWIFFDFEGVNITQLQHVNTSAVCWEAIYVTKKYKNESEDAEYILYGSTFTKTGDCKLRRCIADWTSSTGLTNAKPFQRRITNFKGAVLSASMLNELPFHAPTRDGTGYEGMEYDLLETLKKKLNFRVKIVENFDGDFGKKLPNGSWTGFIGLIASGKSIFSLGTLSISNRRMKAVDFSSPYIFGKLVFVTISPTLESRRLVLIKPLQAEVWAALGATLVLCTFVLYLITHSLPCKSGVRRAYNIWFLLRTLGQQGTSSPAPARYSIRFFIAGWWLFIMVILWSYAGTLTSFMASPGKRPAIDTVQKLQNALISQNIRYGTLKGTTYETFLKIDMSEVHPIFGQTLEENPEGLVKNTEEGMEKVLQGKYAFMHMKSILKWFAATMGYDQFHFSENVFSTDVIGIACQKCHPIKKSFDHIVDRLEETGLISKWYNDAFVKASIRAPPVDVKGVRALSVDDLQEALYILGIGLFTSTFALFIEVIVTNIIYYRRKAMKKKRKEEKERKKAKARKKQQYLMQLTMQNSNYMQTSSQV